MTPLTLQIQSAIAKPDLSRNLKGQLSAALRLLETSDHKWLVCDFAEHGLWLCDRVKPGDQTPYQVLKTIREYLIGDVTWETIAATHHYLWDYGHEIGI